MNFVEGSWLAVIILVALGILARIIMLNREIREKQEWAELDDVRQDYEATYDLDYLLEIRSWLDANKTRFSTVELQSAAVRLLGKIEKKLDTLVK
jgi:hypothetical protein